MIRQSMRERLMYLSRLRSSVIIGELHFAVAIELYVLQFGRSPMLQSYRQE